MDKSKISKKNSYFGGKINWKSLIQVNELEKKNLEIRKLKKEIEGFNEKEELKKLSLSIINFLKEVLITAEENNLEEKELFDELYWFRYSFVDEDEDSFLLDEVSNLFFEFQSNTTYYKSIKKINSIQKSFS